MKKFTSDYFEKKFRILFDRLLVKEGFIEEIKKARKELGIPIEKGFPDTLRLAEYLLKKLSQTEKRHLTFLSFLEYFESEIGKRVKDGDRGMVLDAFLKKNRNGINNADIIVLLQQRVDNHNTFITNSPSVSDIKSLSKIFSREFAIFNKFFGFDLLDEHIIMHFIEKYLFLGQAGVSEYIKSKIACHSCKHIGIAHFSPDRNDMEGQDEGPFSGKYIFNEQTVKLLSSHFNAVFIIIKPYATKEQAIQYIEENWEDLKEHVTSKNKFYEQFGVSPGKIKESDVERNRLVYELYKLSKKDLLKMYHGENNFSLPGVYKEKIISAILKEQHDVDMSSDAIKKTAARFAKNTKIKRDLKDIGDI
jgi:hypothetical protein